MKSISNLTILAAVALQFTGHAVAAPYLDRDAEQAADSSSAETVLLEASDASNWGTTISGEVRNSLGNPIPRASVIYNGVENYTNAKGQFVITKKNGVATNLLIKKPGYRKLSVSPQEGPVTVSLEPIDIKSTYIQTGHLKQGSANATYNNQINLLETTELNAMTIDYKGDEGHVSTGLKPSIDKLKEKGIYTIARVVAFKDNKAPHANPDMALKDLSGNIWKGKGATTFLNPFDERAWSYLIKVSKQAIADGFDEIQFDYVRFPTDGNLKTIKWDKEPNSANRTAAIAGFLKRARFELGALGAFVAADVFGDTAFVSGDSGIGQNIEGIAPYLDFVCPMVYPSGYNKGYAGVKDPVAQPKDIVEVSVKRYRIRAEKVNDEIIVRPWLQSFRDYSGSGRNYGEFEISQQIMGSDNAGGHGFLLWNAGGKFTSAGLKKKKVNGTH